MTLDLYDGTEQDPYFVDPDDRSARGRLWAIEKAVITLAAAGIVQIFKGGGSNPTTLSGYGVTKLWLKAEAGVTDAPGEVRVYDGSGDATLLASWPLLTSEGAAGLRRHFDVYSKEEVDAKTIVASGTDDLTNDSGVSGATASDALDALAALDALKIPLTQKAAANGVASLDGTGKVPSAQLPASTGMDIAGLSTVSGGLAALDRFPVYDVSGAVNGYVLAEDILKSMALLAADSAPSMANDYVLSFDTSASTVKKVLMSKIGAGKQSIWLPAGAWRAVTTGAKTAAQTTTSFDSGANDLTFPVLSFSATVNNYAWTNVKMPYAWDRQAVKFRAVWACAAAGTGNVKWQLGAIAMGYAEAVDGALAVQSIVASAGVATGTLYMTTLSSDLVIGGSPAVDDIIVLEIARLAADAADTGTAALLLVGVEIIYTTSANTDD